MRVLRSLRIFIPLLLVAAIVAGIVVVLTSRNSLKSSRAEGESTWEPLQTGLDQRYAKLEAANNAVKTVPGPLHAISTKVTAAYNDWGRLERTNASVAAQVTAANNLEALGRRLVLAARAAPRLTGQTAALAAMTAYAAQGAPAAANPYNDAVAHFERERTRPAKSIAAEILGYDSIPTYAVQTA